MRPRVIPVLFVRGGRVLNTRKFAKGQYIGDPVNTARLYNQFEVDELIILDGDAGRKGHQIDYRLLDSIRQQCFFPVSYGGGISKLQDAEKLFRLGIEKVILNSVLHDNVSVMAQMIESFGAQSICINFDIIRDWFGRYKLFSHKTGKAYPTPADIMIRKVLETGSPGEIMLTSVQRDGVRSGYDLALLDFMSGFSASVPVVLYGGCADLDDIRRAVQAGAHAAAATSLFVTKQQGVLINYPGQKKLTELLGVDIRGD